MTLNLERESSKIADTNARSMLITFAKINHTILTNQDSMALNKKYDWKLLLVFMTLFLSVYLDSESAQLKEETKGYKTDSINNIKYSNSKTITQDTNDTDHNIKLIVLFSLIPFTLVFSFGVFIWYRLKRENEFRTKEANFKHQIIEVEMKALRAQINPHFIFNCMNSVNNFMQQNNVSEASIYLVKFSNLIRQILENSEHFEISLKKDLETLQLYIQMEQLRLPAGFKYQIKIDEIIDLGGNPNTSYAFTTFC